MRDEPKGWVNPRLNHYLRKGRLHNFRLIEEFNRIVFPNYDTDSTKRQLDIYVEAGYARRKDGKYRFLRNKYPVPPVERIVKKDISKILDKLVEEDRTSFSIKDIKGRMPYDVSEQMIGRLLDKRLFPRISTRHFSIMPYKELKEGKPVWYIPVPHEPEYHTRGHIVVEVLRHDDEKIIMQPDELAGILKVIVEE